MRSGADSDFTTSLERLGAEREKVGVAPAALSVGVKALLETMGI